MQLEPQGRLTIVRTIDDPYDTNTYYVRAYIRKSLTDELLDTVNLTDRGSRRFSYRDYRLPADPSGEGLDIDITTRVFTNAAYTTASDVYGDDCKQYILAKRYNPVYRGGELAGIGSKIDYNKLKKVVRRVVKKEISNIPEGKQIDPILITGPIIRAIDDKHIPEPIIPEKTDLGGLIRLVGKAIMAIEAQPVFKETDLTETHRIIAEAMEAMRKMAETNNNLSEDRKTELQGEINKLGEQFSKITNMEFKIPAAIKFSSNVNKDKKPKKHSRAHY